MKYLKWHPFLNALAAIGYITIVVLALRFIESIRHDTPDTLIDGIGAISLFVFSAAVMAFLFFYQPILRLVENKPTEAITYFLQTLGIFGLITATLVILVSMQ